MDNLSKIIGRGDLDSSEMLPNPRKIVGGETLNSLEMLSDEKLIDLKRQAVDTEDYFKAYIIKQELDKRSQGKIGRMSHETLLSNVLGQTSKKRLINIDEDNGEQPISRIVVDYVGPTGSDETHYEKCHFDPEVVRLEDAIKFIVKKQGIKEYGEIRVYRDYDGKRLSGCVANFEYRDGAIIHQDSRIPNDSKVKLIRGDGGWSLMDYSLYLV